MSHIAKIKLQIKDLNILKRTCERLNLRFVENQKTYTWYGRVVHPEDLKIHTDITEEQLGKCDHAIQVPTAKLGYEIGVIRRGDEYILLFDDWDQGLRKAVGHHGELLKQAYTAEVVKAQAKLHNYFYSEKKVDNTLKITLTAV